MPFIPHTDEEIRQMLDTIGASSIEDLFDEVPGNLRCGRLEQIPEGLTELCHELRELGAETRADLGEGRPDGVVEYRSLQSSEQIFSQREGKNLVGRERDIPELEALDEPVVRAPLALFAHHREAREHQRVEIAIHRASHAAQIF